MMMKTASRSFGEDPYVCLKLWPEDCFVQCGGDGIVITDKDCSIEEALSDSDSQKELIKAVVNKESQIEHYRTAFFEAFLKNPSCFIRGEGKSIEEAEEDAYDQYTKIISCKHPEFNRKGREDGYAFCKSCPYSGMVLAPTTNCETCGKPAHFGKDLLGQYYCERHYYKLSVDSVFPPAKEGELLSMFSISGQRNFFIRNQLKWKELSKAQLQYAITNDDLIDLKKIVDNLYNQMADSIIEKTYEEIFSISTDPLVWKVLVEKAIPIYAKSKSLI